MRIVLNVFIFRRFRYVYVTRVNDTAIVRTNETGRILRTRRESFFSSTDFRHADPILIARSNATHNRKKPFGPARRVVAYVDQTEKEGMLFKYLLYKLASNPHGVLKIIDHRDIKQKNIIMARNFLQRVIRFNARIIRPNDVFLRSNVILE